MSTFVGFFTVHITLTPLEGKDGENRVGSGLQDHVSHIQQVMKEVQVRTSETFQQKPEEGTNEALEECPGLNRLKLQLIVLTTRVW